MRVQEKDSDRSADFWFTSEGSSKRLREYDCAQDANTPGDFTLYLEVETNMHICFHQSFKGSVMQIWTDIECNGTLRNVVKSPVSKEIKILPHKGFTIPAKTDHGLVMEDDKLWSTPFIVLPISPSQKRTTMDVANGIGTFVTTTYIKRDEITETVQFKGQTWLSTTSDVLRRQCNRRSSHQIALEETTEGAIELTDEKKLKLLKKLAESTTVRPGHPWCILRVLLVSKERAKELKLRQDDPKHVHEVVLSTPAESSDAETTSSSSGSDRAASPEVYIEAAVKAERQKSQAPPPRYEPGPDLEMRAPVARMGSDSNEILPAVSTLASSGHSTSKPPALGHRCSSLPPAQSAQQTSGRGRDAVSQGPESSGVTDHSTSIMRHDPNASRFLRSTVVEDSSYPWTSLALAEAMTTMFRKGTHEDSQEREKTKTEKVTRKASVAQQVHPTIETPAPKSQKAAKKAPAKERAKTPPTTKSTYVSPRKRPASPSPTPEFPDSTNTYTFHTSTSSDSKPAHVLARERALAARRAAKDEARKAEVQRSKNLELERRLAEGYDRIAREWEEEREEAEERERRLVQEEEEWMEGGSEGE